MARKEYGSGAAVCERGSVSLELVGAVPVVLLCLLAAAQIAIGGYALWSAGLAARAGARAELTGRDPAGAVRRSLPPGLSADVRVEAGHAVRVGVLLPRVLPVLPEARVFGSSDLGGG
jgi:hypothetical protein